MGARLIYLHGFASSPSSSKAQELTRRFAAEGVTMEIPDLAEGNFENLTLTGQLQIVEALARREPVRMIGSSLGGYLAALYAARHPETEKLVLLAPAFQFAKRLRAGLGAELVNQWSEAGTMAFHHYGAGADRPLKYRFLEDAQRYEDFPAVTQPCLILHGRNDDVVPWELSREFAGHNSAAQVDILESDHQLLDVLDFVWDRARAFFEYQNTAPS